ncbi:UbiH/UbiF/VisC/COQ6 family ubiquinone biosynthesis hydroxylase [Sphingomonas sp. CGMCC 1.13654]|uniref:UbiH/UbiF/VisC/COQ6 family ubiquinone biosynthesis hydroxylase n=1 Tax=Sphingomonas chungangi TaxID=2683589 RepID=A0A838L9M6_9SPHN|nr:UbiH/UbiF/VisC/COQ6 family ubiquinone biosynthesis hydroxylase [Sphingomonas chungangi]MBA2935512.1 UbiH/UbiF/VisC/COQ6 family ubiquinone biosynthesis hydroxylase [Sphingomonas chungangi]MVW57019.1 ubiquinone biosynthesis protein UbiH [Sphingomonas chungangi]
MSDTLHSDVIILGAGLVGCALATALAGGGVTVTLVDPAPATQIRDTHFDGRASAVSSTSWRMMEAIGATERFAQYANPIERIEVGEQGARGLLNFQPDLENDGPLGMMVENRYLRIGLREAAEASEGVTVLMSRSAAQVERDSAGVRVTLDDGRPLKAALLVGAEGRRSPTRDAAGIAVARWEYHHTAMVGMLEHEADHRNIAHELFFTAGPFALLPMQGGHRSALVWTVSEADAPAMLSLSERAFTAEAQKRMGGMLGAIRLAAPLASFPLGFHHTARITAERLALVGDAGHGIHPIAGQGVNLGFRDAAALAEVLIEGVRLGLDPGDHQLLQRYERWRGLDTFLVASATDGLTRLFGIPGKPASRIRRFGIGMVKRIAPLKDVFMAEARGESGTLPKLLTGQMV